MSDSQSASFIFWGVLVKSVYFFPGKLLVGQSRAEQREREREGEAIVGMWMKHLPYRYDIVVIWRLMKSHCDVDAASSQRWYGYGWGTNQTKQSMDYVILLVQPISHGDTNSKWGNRKEWQDSFAEVIFFFCLFLKEEEQMRWARCMQQEVVVFTLVCAESIPDSSLPPMYV